MKRSLGCGWIDAIPSLLPPVFCLLLSAFLCCLARAEEPAIALPEGVKAEWDLTKPHREQTPTRERTCLNGLWRWQPADAKADAPPTANWGWFKVPGCWPGVTDYMQKDCQTVFAHPSWKDRKLREIAAAWYEREFSTPKEHAGDRMALHIDYLNSLAIVFIDGKKAGDLRYPGGELDITALCRPGEKQRLSMLVVAMPLNAVMLSYNDTAAAREVKGAVQRRGLCGDVSLVVEPKGPRIGDVKVSTSFRRGEITFDVALEGLDKGRRYTLLTTISDGTNTLKTGPTKAFALSDLKDGRFHVTEKWKPEKLWDTHTPQNQHVAKVWLTEAEKLLDASLDQPFGFREFWINGKDFYLNGTRIFLCGIPFDNAQIGAAAASYEGAKESLLRLKKIGINFVYTHNYGCEPGSHLSFAEVLRAADDVGMLVSFSMPHFSHYQWKAADADANNGYARHAEFYVRAAQNHPAVVCYSMSHNATGYGDDMNPDMIDGKEVVRDTWSRNNAALAQRAEAIVNRFDPARFVYHHAGGNIGVMHTVNFYPNWAPIQEMSDWLGHWAEAGTKPFFFCEYGAPFTWDWAMYRGWYKGERSFGSAAVPWEFCFAEWNAQFLGGRAFKLGEPEKANLRWEAKQFRAGKTWHRWDYPYELGSRAFDDRYEVFAKYFTDNWRAFRTWGASGISPWEHGVLWKLRDGVDKKRKELKTDWQNLQRPGFSPDYRDAQYERIDLAYDWNDWIVTPAAEALVKNNGPVLAYIAGKEGSFTSKDHNFLPGETVEKQIVVINNSREKTTCDVLCELGVPTTSGQFVWGLVFQGQFADIPTGEQKRETIRVDLSKIRSEGPLLLRLRAKFSKGAIQEDSLALHVVPPVSHRGAEARFALFDPRGETSKLLGELRVPYQRVEANDDLSEVDVLIIGKGALTVDGPGPDVSRVRDGLKVIVFEQSAEVLEKRFGFRVVEYGLRQVFPRISRHPLLGVLTSVLTIEHLADWRGAATLTSPRLKYEMKPMHGPTVKWCDIPVTRVWRCGNQGNVASVLIEKPARGDFLPIVDGGFSLQYSPLLEYREGKGAVLFCQMDVTGRTESDPAAALLAYNLIDYAMRYRSPSQGNQPSPPAPLPPAGEGSTRKAVYAGEAAGKEWLTKAGVAARAFDGKLANYETLIVGPGGGEALKPHLSAVKGFLSSGGKCVGIALDDTEAGLLVSGITTAKAEHIATDFSPFPAYAPLAGIGPADVHNRDPRQVPLIKSGATVVGDGVLAFATDRSAVFLQLAPWTFDVKLQNQKRTFRRTSCALARLLAAAGVAGSTPVIERFKTPATKDEKRWLDGLYLDTPEEMDDPYRFFRW